MERYLDLGSVSAVKREASRLNELIAAANKTDLGPHLPQPLLDIEALVNAWSEARRRP